MLKWVGVLCALGSSASAEPRVYGEGGVAIGVPSGVPDREGTGVGAMFDVGVTIVSNVSLVFGYRDMGNIAVYPGNPTSINGSPATTSYSEWMLGARLTTPAIWHLSLFGELALLLGRTDIADEDFAGGDDEVHWHVGASVRAGAFVDFGRIDGVRVGLGAAGSLRATPHQSCDTNGGFDCVQSWASVDLFLRVAY